MSSRVGSVREYAYDAPSLAPELAPHALSTRELPENDAALEDETQAAFLGELAFHTDGIGWVQLIHCLRRRGVLRMLAERAPQPTTLRELCERFGAELGYMNVVLRVLAAQGWLERSPAPMPGQTELTLTAAGHELSALLEASDPTVEIVRFAPIAEHMAEYLFGAYEPPASAPSLARLARMSRTGWGLPEGSSEVVRRLRQALDGNLLGPVAVALKAEFYPGLSGLVARHAPDLWRHAPVAWWLAQVRRGALLDAFEGEPGVLDLAHVRGDRARITAAFEVLANAGWLRKDGRFATLTEKGAHARARAWAYGVPVSYLPMFGRIDTLLFGHASTLWSRAPGEPERHVDRSLNVRASGASHRRYFAAADKVVLEAFNRPFAEQPLGFVDMGCGDGAWLEHVWHLIVEQSDRGRLMRAFPHSPRYQLLMVGADYNDAALRAARERLTRAGIPHLALFGDVNDPQGLRQRLAEAGVDSRELLHGSSFLVHNRPYTGVKDPAAAGRRSADSQGAYVWRGQALDNRELEQNLVEFFGGWREIIGHHGMLVIELHDPERVVIGKTLTNYLLTHGLSDQLTVGLEPFLRAAAEAGLKLEPHLERRYPADPKLATVSVSYFTR
jgi:DNA-binding MarR family transcriptional regulator